MQKACMIPNKQIITKHHEQLLMLTRLSRLSCRLSRSWVPFEAKVALPRLAQFSSSKILRALQLVRMRCNAFFACL